MNKKLPMYCNSRNDDPLCTTVFNLYFYFSFQDYFVPAFDAWLEFAKTRVS
jgi:hypothetical protein